MIYYQYLSGPRISHIREGDLLKIIKLHSHPTFKYQINVEGQDCEYTDYIERIEIDEEGVMVIIDDLTDDPHYEVEDPYPELPRILKQFADPKIKTKSIKIYDPAVSRYYFARVVEPVKWDPEFEAWRILVEGEGDDEPYYVSYGLVPGWQTEPD